MQLEASHVILTGAAGGIGRALARHFAQAGARLTLVDVDREPLAALAGELDALAVCADVGVEQEVQALVARGRARHGEVDLFFSNAGIAGPAAGAEAPEPEWQRLWQVNVMAHVYAARAVLPAMLERGQGYLASTASAAGLLTQISAAPYSVTKHAAVALAEWLWINHRDAGIRVSVLCPQGVRTPMLDLAFEQDPVGSVPLIAGGLLEADEVARVTVEAIEQERFLILPHPQVGEYLALKGAQPERWLEGMRRMRRGALGRAPEGGRDS